MTARRLVFGRGGIRPLLPILGLVAVVCFGQIFGVELTSEQGITELNRVSGDLLPKVVAVVGGAVLVLSLFIFIRRIGFSVGKAGGSFRDAPEQYHGHQVRLLGRIEKILEGGTSTSLPQMSGTNRPANDDRRSFIRLVVSSRALRSGENIMVIVPMSDASLALKLRSWVEIIGEYSHGRTDAPGGLLKRRPHFYGYLHRTSPPRGDIRVLQRKPGRSEKWLTVREVPSSSAPPSRATPQRTAARR